jgi:hypothetical protein
LPLLAAPAFPQLQWSQPVFPANWGVAIAQDAARGRVLAFYGFDANTNAYPGETFEWDGFVWRQLFPAHRPPGRHGHVLAYDAARARMVLYGGANYSVFPTIYFNDTWEWDGTDWTQRLPVTNPPGLRFPAMAWDAGRARMVLFGGRDAAGVRQDTWEWDGINWTQRFPVTRPSARDGPAMAYDVAGGRTLLFGGVASGPRLGDTWEWDGVNWTQRVPATSPTPRHAALAHDPVRGRTVLFGGDDGMQFLSDTWEWDGNTWLARAPATVPPTRASHSMAFDAARGVTVLFGGSGRADTWEWNGVDWTLASAGTRPPERHGHAMAWDGARRRVVLFGGIGGPGGVALGDTWEWDGTWWLPRQSLVNPSARDGHAMAWDSARGRIVLFGGRDAGGARGDTWEWDGTGWALGAAGPPASAGGHGLAYDSARARTVLLVGGQTWEWGGGAWTQRVVPGPGGSGPLVYDSARARTVHFNGTQTWEWDGAAWTRRTPPLTPPPRSDFALAYDGIRSRTLLLGGGTAFAVPCQVFNDLWEWNGTTWLARSPASPPPTRDRHAMAYDAARGRMVLFGGRAYECFCTPKFQICTFQQVRFDTSELAAPCDSIGPGHPGGGGLTLTCATPPRVGTSFCVSFPSPSGVAWLVLGPAPALGPPLPLGPPIWCAAGSLHPAPLALVPLAAGNPATLCVSLPPEAALVGQSFCVQGTSLQPAGCFRLTDGVVVTLQP